MNNDDCWSKANNLEVPKILRKSSFSSSGSQSLESVFNLNELTHEEQETLQWVVPSFPVLATPGLNVNGVQSGQQAVGMTYSQGLQSMETVEDLMAHGFHERTLHMSPYDTQNDPFAFHQDFHPFQSSTPAVHRFKVSENREEQKQVENHTEKGDTPPISALNFSGLLHEFAIKQTRTNTDSSPGESLTSSFSQNSGSQGQDRLRGREKGIKTFVNTKRKLFEVPEDTASLSSKRGRIQSLASNDDPEYLRQKLVRFKGFCDKFNERYDRAKKYNSALKQNLRNEQNRRNIEFENKQQLSVQLALKRWDDDISRLKPYVIKVEEKLNQLSVDSKDQSQMKTMCKKLFTPRRQSTPKLEVSRPVIDSRIRTSHDISDSSFKASSRVSSSSETAKKITKMAIMREQAAISKQYVNVMKTTAKTRQTALKDFASVVGSGPKKATSVAKAIKPKTVEHVGVKPKITGNERKKRRPKCPQVHGTDSRYSWCIACQERKPCVRYVNPASGFPRI